jgi:hypothetical protein
VGAHEPGGAKLTHRLPIEPFTTASVARLAVGLYRQWRAGQTVGKKDGATAPAGKRLDEVLFSY